MHAAENHPTPSRPQPADVRRAIAAVVTSGSTAELERVVRAYVRALRKADVPPEQALRRVKDVVGAAHATPLPARGAPAPDRLAADVVSWFVAEYYRAD
jgi:hypothetical protein